MKTRLTALLLIFIVLLSAGCSGADEPPQSQTASAVGTVTAETPSAAEEGVVCRVERLSSDGDMILDLSFDELTSRGIAHYDTVTVALGGKRFELPVIAKIGDVAQGKAALLASPGENAVLTVNGGAFVLEKRLASDLQSPVWKQTEEENRVTVTLKAEAGYFDTWIKLTLKRSNDRQDYPDLTDAEYANFRPVATTGMGAGKLYRSSSPVNPSYNRSRQADEACRAAGIRSAVNLTDDPSTVTQYAGYGDTYYSTIGAAFVRSLSMDFYTESFGADIAQALIFISENEAPFLVHCMEGKDRTGFLCGLLEAFMGASSDEIVDDYLRSYANFYGLARTDERCVPIAERNIKKSLAAAFSLSGIDGEDLAAGAVRYMKRIGLSDEQIGALKSKLQ